MAWSLDARIPLVILGEAAALPAAAAAAGPAALLAEAPLPPLPPDLLAAMDSFTPAAAPHPAACACCAGQSPAAAALDRLFQARARGRAAWFGRVVALARTEAGRAELAHALATDRLARARFRLGP